MLRCTTEPVLDYTNDDDGIHLSCATCGWSKALGFSVTIALVREAQSDHDTAKQLTRRINMDVGTMSDDDLAKTFWARKDDTGWKEMRDEIVTRWLYEQGYSYRGGRLQEKP